MTRQGSDNLPLIARDLTGIIAWDANQSITCEMFLQDVAQLSARLAVEMADKQHAVNLCNDRYGFLVSFAAVICCGQTNLLPPSQVTSDIQAIADEYADSYFLVTEEIAGLKQPQLKVDSTVKPAVNTAKQVSIPLIPYQHIAAIAFTSGSSGKPTPHQKRWGEIITCAKLTVVRFDLSQQLLQVVSTVPSQHMYGLETTVLHPLIAPLAIYNGQPFFPEDIRQAISTATNAVELVTTPVHLRACVKANLEWKNIKFILSAAAPLSPELAQQVVSVMHAPVFEIYGCTEAGSMATRETMREQTWLPHEGSRFYQQDDSYYLEASYLPQPVELADKLRIHADGRFDLLGRNTDVIKIAGKRAHIGDLNNKLVTIKGVQAGAFYQPDEDENIAKGVARLTAFVVAPETETAEILAQLSEIMDPVFLPRPLYKVSDLPFSNTGKLPVAALRELYARMQKETSCQR